MSDRQADQVQARPEVLPAEIIRWWDVQVGDEVIYLGDLVTVDAFAQPGWKNGDDRRMTVCLSGQWHCPKRDDWTAVRRYEVADVSIKER